ncbi:hypothetical protein EHQ27_19215 [Leptospira wolffii]|nr:hypothetical protein EHQ32_07655 [Leptospira wolffii]TGK65650.1 hypothetical protein EHQ27_19215 [Leptospira wolffii]TGK73937.1 hypothetical protein EHQ35_06110 [Leptospira wolffii]TGL28799.1 hypothetical protein EHQ57_12635 [Leptospira wolffii]
MYSYFRIFLFLFAVFFANGCILLTNGDFSGIRDRFSESEFFPYKRLSLRILYIPEKNDIIFNLSEEEQQEREQEWKKILSSAYRNSGLFEEVVLDEPGDIEMRIKIVEVEAEDRNFSYLISKGYGFAPYREEGSFLMSSDFYNSEGVHLGSVDLSEKYEYYYQVLFVFLMPFYYPSGEYEKLVENMGLKTLQQALSKGYLKIGSSKK